MARQSGQLSTLAHPQRLKLRSAVGYTTGIGVSTYGGILRARVFPRPPEFTHER